MSTKTKTVLKGFDYMHCDDFAKYLGDMAAKGWHFKEWGAGLKFEKGEPEEAVYAVEVFQKASENDMRPEPDTQEFAEYCESAGWKFIDAKQQFCIFKRIDHDAMALYTPEERVNNAIKGTFSGSAISLLVIYGINAILQWIGIATLFESRIFSGSFFFQLSVWTVMFFGQFVILLYAFYKSRMLKKKVRMGENIYIGNREDGKYHITIKGVYVILLMALLMYYFFITNNTALIILNLVIIVGTFGFSLLINKIRPERDTNIAIQIVFSIVLIISIIFFTMMIFMEDGENSNSGKDIIPLTFTDYRKSDDIIESTRFYGDSNFLGSVSSYFVFGIENSVYYDIYKSDYTWILDKIWEEELNGKKSNEEVMDCTTDWGAQKAFRNNKGTYYVRYENAILVFDDDEDVYLSEEQIEIILDKLALR